MAKEKKVSTPFDKFIDDQLQRQNKKSEKIKSMYGDKETPQQMYNKLYREKPNNRIVWDKK